MMSILFMKKRRTQKKFVSFFQVINFITNGSQSDYIMEVEESGVQLLAMAL
jgi:hypothetical protein